jgi:hypothetical protein
MEHALRVFRADAYLRRCAGMQGREAEEEYKKSWGELSVKRKMLY